LHYNEAVKLKELFKVTGLPVVAASLCCLTPLVLVFFGLATVSFASSLSDFLYGQHKWIFRSVGLVLLLISVVIYFRTQKGICTIDEIKKRRQEIVNITLLFLIASVLGYIFFLYVVVHYAGVFFNIWENY